MAAWDSSAWRLHILAATSYLHALERDDFRSFHLKAVQHYIITAIFA